ncbi:amino acid kinase family protein [Archaeoglobus fulgidus]|uniref:amino acid kinase family protein n=1 Tax=Archaeoglobus fulgidus TaxID=2234 RepID=UPI0018CC1325|nr:hypothetical protein [Archaeoglobus fulgidus]
MKSDVTILKIGGSVITDKSRGAFEKLKERELREVCRAISEKWRNLIVVHGAGSFGHPQRKKIRFKPSWSLKGSSRVPQIE